MLFVPMIVLLSGIMALTIYLFMVRLFARRTRTMVKSIFDDLEQQFIDEGNDEALTTLYQRRREALDRWDREFGSST